MKKFMKKTAAVLMAAAMATASMPLTSIAADKWFTEDIHVNYLASIEKPTYKIKGAAGYRKIKLSSSTPNATIYYTTDGSTPTVSSKTYTGPFKITKNTKVKAIAVYRSEQSAVMSKTVRVTTMLGDVTGDGTITENDYKRLKSWLVGSTSYICSDNADVNGNGKVNSTDLKYIRQYLDGDIDNFPASGKTPSTSTSSSTSVKKPTITVYKVYGGMKFDIQTETSGAQIYYTTNGTEPTTNSKRYDGTFTVDADTIVKAVAYKNGTYSAVKTRNVEVETCKAPVSDMSDSQSYNDVLKLTLSCNTAGANIYYTTDGSDPVKNGRLYSGKLELTSNTTLKIYATAKGCANSPVMTYNYKVVSTNFTISGVVWNDTMRPETKADGIQQYGETGIDGITVKLVNSATNYVEQTTTTAVINGIHGSYVLDKGKASNSYKVVFEFNGMKYRPYQSVVTNGNQAVSTSPLDITVRNNGAYTDNSNTPYAAVNSYSAATVSSSFIMTATTSSTYSSTATNVNLALATNVYGDLNLKFSETKVTTLMGVNSQASNGQQVFGGDTITYTLDVNNASPFQKLNSASLYLYVDKNLEIQSVALNTGSAITYSYVSSDSNGVQKFILICPAINANSTLYFNITVKVRASVQDRSAMNCYAEVGEYTFSGSCFDIDSIPGNLTAYSPKETDEAATILLYGYADVTASQSISWDQGNDFLTPINVGNSKNYYFTITNGKDLNINSDLTITTTNSALVTVQTFSNGMQNGDLKCVLSVTGNATGTGSITVAIRKDASKYISMNFNVI